MTYKERFAQLVADIIDNVKRRKTHSSLRFAYNGVGYDLADRSQRIKLIERVTDEYVAAHADVNQAALERWEMSGCKGERPASIPLDSALIERLTDAILDEELTDTHPDKITRTEYPFMSTWQIDLRRDRETGLKAAEETGTDGRDYRKPTRRRRTSYENWCVDRDAKIRNADRAAQYKRDTAPGPIVAYKVRENGGVFADEFTAAKSVAATWRDRLSLVY